MNKLSVLLFGIFATVSFSAAFASYNVTFLNTTVILNSTNSSAKVVEILSLFISNSSISQYESARGAYNLTLSHWQTLIGSPLITEHILNPHGSIHNFAFLPGPVVPASGGGSATMTMSYSVSNVTTVTEIAPRKFEYVFNSTVFNFQHTAGGQELPRGVRLNIIVPDGAHIVSIYPLPDYPQTSVLGTYANATVFSWYTEEPLSSFSFSYTLTESLQAEVLGYFGGLYSRHRSALYAAAVLVIALFVAYIYFKYIIRQ